MQRGIAEIVCSLIAINSISLLKIKLIPLLLSVNEYKRYYIAYSFVKILLATIVVLQYIATARLLQKCHVDELKVQRS